MIRSLLTPAQRTARVENKGTPRTHLHYNIISFI